MRLQTKPAFPRRITAIVLAVLLAMPFVTPLAAFAEETIPAEAAPVPAGNIPATEEDVPAEGEDVPAEDEGIPVAAEDTFAAQEDAPEVVDGTPAAAEEAPAAAEETPAAEDTPAGAEEEDPAVVDEASVTAEDVPAEAEDAPAAVDETPAAEDAPAVAEETPAVAEEVPAAAEETPAAVDAPAVAEDALAVVEEVPAAVDETPAITEETPTAVEETPAAAEDAQAAGEQAPEAAEGTPAGTDLPVGPGDQKDDENRSISNDAERTPVPAGKDNNDAAGELRSVEIRVGEYIITACGAFPEGTEIQAVEIPRDAAAKMSGKATLFAYDIRLVVDGQIWQPEEHGTSVQLSMRNVNEDLSDIKVDILHVKTNLIDADNTLSEDALEKALQDLDNGSAATETIGAETGENGVGFGTSSFSAFVGNTDSRVLYVYNATLFNEESGNYPGVYTTKLTPNTASAEEAKTIETIGMPSIADANLPDTPTTESPAIIQGAAVGYEQKTGPTSYELLDPERPRPEPYSDFTVKTLTEQAQDGTTHTKLSGFDGTYVIVRLDVSEFFSSGTDTIDNLYLHMEQKDNKALMPAATVAKPAADAAATVDPADYTPTNSFTDGLGNRSASYKLSDLVDQNGTTPYVDIILFATAANVAGADAGKENTPNGDVPLAFYVDNVLEYNSELKEYDPSNTANVDPNADPNDPNAKTSTAYDAKWHAKFFDESKAATTNASVSHYLVKGSDLALETMVENSGGADKSTGTTYWSLKKALENPYYDQEIDKSPEDPGCGRTVTLMSEVAVTEELRLQGNDANNIKKRVLDVNSFDIQIANNTNTDASTYNDGFMLSDAWLTIADNSNTTGAEMAVGNNAHFVIDAGGKLIIDDTCQLEIEWDGATTTTTGGQEAQAATQDILNNGLLDLRAGGEIINNGIITIEGTEGKPYQVGSGTEQQVIDSQKGSGEMTIQEGAKLTNNGSLVIYGKLYNLGTLINNGKYNDVIKSNDPDKGAFDYHKGIQIAWKDDVTQKNIEAGSLINGKDRDGRIVAGAKLINNGDIVLTPGTLENSGMLYNNRGANIYSAAATEAIIPITPDPATPTIVTKRIKLDPVKLSSIVNNGTLINNGNIAPATVALNDNIGFGALTSPGDHPELFVFTNNGVFINIGDFTASSGPKLVRALAGSEYTVNDTWLYLYEDGTFLIIFADGTRVTGTYQFTDGMLIFTLKDGTMIRPEVDADGNYVYSIAGHEIIISADFVYSTVAV